MNYNWTDEQKKALEQSIAHHEDNLAKLKEWDSKGLDIIRWARYWGWGYNSTFIEAKKLHFDAEHCALCKKYLNGHNCSICPLYITGNHCGKYGSVWSKCASAVGNAAIIEAASEMVMILKDTLAAGVEHEQKQEQTRQMLLQQESVRMKQDNILKLEERQELLRLELEALKIKIEELNGGI